MNIDKLIAQITEEVCARIMSETPSARDANLARSMEYTLINPRLKIAEIQSMCSMARQNNYACILRFRNGSSALRKSRWPVLL